MLTNLSTVIKQERLCLLWHNFIFIYWIIDWEDKTWTQGLTHAGQKKIKKEKNLTKSKFKNSLSLKTNK